jgi:Domain of Unknown Function (DUF1259)
VINNKVKDIICLGVMVMLFFLLTYSITTTQQTALAQQKHTSAGNVTAQVVPQGTSLQVANKTANSASPTGATTSSGNITAPVVPQGTSLNASNATTSNKTISSSNNKLDCSAIASNIGGKVIPNPDVCDVLIIRQAPQIKGGPSNNISLNKFSAINSLIEFVASSSSSISEGNQQMVFAMGEFGLLEPQLAPMVKAAGNSNWTISAIHNHMVLEHPKMVFMHWSAQGNLNTIENQIKNALAAVSKIASNTH